MQFVLDRSVAPDGRQEVLGRNLPAHEAVAGLGAGPINRTHLTLRSVL